MKKFIFTIIAFALFLVVFFLIGEMFFRIFAGEPNKLAAITQKEKSSLFAPNIVIPNKSSVESEFDLFAKINNYGYRGGDFKMPKDRNALRIFAVGDSFTFGVGAEDNQTIPAVLQKLLIEKNINAEVINAGIGHASTITNYVNLRDIHLKYKPDAVIYLFDLTDLRDDWYSEVHAIFDKNGEIKEFNNLFVNGKRDWWRTCVNYSKFCQWINNKIVRSFLKLKQLGFKEYARAIKEGKRAKSLIINSKEPISDDVLVEYDGLLMMRGIEKKAAIDKNWVRTEKYLNKIKQLLDANNIPFVLVMYPHGIYVGKDEWSKGRVTWGFEEGKLYTDYYAFELVEKYAKEKGIPFINTLNDFPKDSETKYFYDWDGHMRSAGYNIVASGIFNSPQFHDLMNKFMPYIIW